MDNKFKDFWNKQTTSRHRYNDDDFYAHKAKEHASFIKDEHKQLGAIDLGCGSGELLVYLSSLVKVNTGLDYSDNMLSLAAEKLGDDTGIALINDDIFTYLPESSDAIWLTTGAINQYLSREETGKMLDIFKENTDVKALYMFDCVDPLRLKAISLGIKYETIDVKEQSLSHKVLRFFFNIYRRLKFGFFATFNLYRNFQHIGRMGYAQFPIFWVEECKKRNLKIEIVSSKFYEYRYHVLIQK